MKNLIKNYKTKYFGTDGFRGEVNVNLTSLNAYKVGRFLGWYFTSKLNGENPNNYRAKIVVGKDTRRSSYMLEYSLVAGITASGADAYLLHVTTTPSVSFITKQDGFDAGIMITASHNPYYDNGIKILNRNGEKLDDLTTFYIEQYLDGNLSVLGVLDSDLPLAKKEKIGFVVDYVSGRNRYLGYLISLATNSYKNLRIGLDCANGASFKLAKSVFDALGAKTYVIGEEPNGLNVNEDCGSTNVKNLCELVKEKRLDLGFAFDGDADRCIAVDEKGNVVDGDKILYVLAMRLKRQNNLNENTVVTTIMSNSGLENCLKEKQISCVQTKVGDRYVYEKIKESEYSLGGEQSGHIIIKKYATTGDGILTAIMLTEEVCEQKASLSELAKNVVLYPQFVKNVKVISKSAVTSDKTIQNAVNDVKKEFSSGGRILIRESGTEPVIRIMVECESLVLAKKYANSIANLIKERGYSID